MKWLKELSDILKKDGWDYAKLVQVISKFGGPKKAGLKFASLFTLLGMGIIKTGGSLSNNIKKKNKKISPKDQDTINAYTQNYLDKREEIKNAGEDVTLLDKEYNDFMTKYFG